MPDVHLVVMLKGKSGSALVRNTLFDSVEALFDGLGPSVGDASGDHAAPASPLMGVTTLLLRTLRSTQEAVGEEVAHRLGASLCAVLSFYGHLRWVALEGALCALRELAALVDSPIGHARQVIGPQLEAKVLQPLATKLAKAATESGPSQEKWLEEFQEQWNAHQNSPQELPSTPFLERELLDRAATGASSDQPSAPEGRARCLRVLLSARRLNLSLNAGGHPPQLDEMPGLDEAEEKERERFQPGVPVHIGRMNRVKCVLVRASRAREQEVMYLLSSQSLLVLVRPDEQKPFWAVPVIVEPLRSVRFMMTLQEGSTVMAVGGSGNAGPSAVMAAGGGGNAGPPAAGGRPPWKPDTAPLQQITAAPGGNGDETTRALRLEVLSPCSPELQKQMQQNLSALSPGYIPSSRGNLSPMPGSPDNMAMTMPIAPILAGAVVPVDDRLAHSVPQAMVGYGDTHAGLSGSRSTPLVLLFADERRKRVACKIFVQARHGVCQRMAAGLEAFLEEVRRPS